MESGSILSRQPSSHALPSCRSLSGDQLGVETLNLVRGFGATTNQASEKLQGNEGEKSKVSKEKTTGLETQSHHGLKETLLELKLGPATCITKKSQGNEGEKSKVSKEKTTGLETQSHPGLKETLLELKLGSTTCITKKPQGNEGEKSKVSKEKTTGLETQSHHGLKETLLELMLGPTTCITKKPQGNEGEKSKVSKEKATGLETQSRHGLEEISLELLKLGCDKCRSKKGPWSSWITKKRKATENTANVLPPSFKRMKLGCPNDASLELKLELGPTAMKKTIQTSDIGHLSRLLLPKKWVQEHIGALWEAGRVANGVPVAVWDFDTKSEHELMFKQWASGSYVLIEKWTKEFVKRRSLNEGDEIGLYWDPANSRFIFSILKRTGS